MKFLSKRCEINGQRLFKVNASIEIARRGYEIIIKKSKKFYPVVWLKESLKHQWKETVNDLPGSWKELFDLIKNSKLSYRASLNDVTDFNVFSKKVRMYKIYQF